MGWFSLRLPIAAWEPDELAIGTTLLLIVLFAFVWQWHLRRFDSAIAGTTTKPSEAIDRFWSRIWGTSFLLAILLVLVWTVGRTHLFGRWLGLDAV